MQSESQTNQAEGPYSFWQHCANVTGTEIDLKTWNDGKAKASELERQTAVIASKLASIGIPAIRPGADTYHAVGVCTGQFEVVTSWRHINFLPAVASHNRSQVIKRLAFFADSRAYLRYLVVTNGARCPVEVLRGRLSDLARSISRFAAMPELRAMGVTVELRVSELTAERDANGRWSYHPHANVIVNCARHINWQSFMKLCDDHLPGHWRDCGRLVDPAEAIKYFIKPADICEHNRSELADLFFALKGLRMVTPMNELKELGQTLACKRLKIAKRRDGEDWRWCFVNLRDVRKVEPDKPRRGDNVAIALLPAQPRFTNRFEPVVIVRNFHSSAAVMMSQNELSKGYESSLAAWQRACAIRFTPSRQLTDDSVCQNGLKVCQTVKQQRSGPRIYHLAPS